MVARWSLVSCCCRFARTGRCGLLAESRTVDAQAREAGCSAANGARAASASRRALPDFATLVERYGPAVVNVSVVGKAQEVPTRHLPGMSPNDPFYEFFRRFGRPMPRGDMPHAARRRLGLHRQQPTATS